MAEAERRELERRFGAGDAAAGERLVALALREGRLGGPALELLAQLDFAAAREAQARLDPAWRPLAALDAPAARPLFERCGPELAVRLALAGASAALPRWGARWAPPLPASGWALVLGRPGEPAALLHLPLGARHAFGSGPGAASGGLGDPELAPSHARVLARADGVEVTPADGAVWIDEGRVRGVGCAPAGSLVNLTAQTWFAVVGPAEDARPAAALAAAARWAARPTPEARVEAALASARARRAAQVARAVGRLAPDPEAAARCEAADYAALAASAAASAVADAEPGAAVTALHLARLALHEPGAPRGTARAQVEAAAREALLSHVLLPPSTPR